MQLLSNLRKTERVLRNLKRNKLFLRKRKFKSSKQMPNGLLRCKPRKLKSFKKLSWSGEKKRRKEEAKRL